MLALTFLREDRQQIGRGRDRARGGGESRQQAAVRRCRVVAARQTREIRLVQQGLDAVGQSWVHDAGGARHAAVVAGHCDGCAAVMGRGRTRVVQQIVLQAPDRQLGGGAELAVDGTPEIAKRAQIRLQRADQCRIGISRWAQRGVAIAQSHDDRLYDKPIAGLRIAIVGHDSGAANGAGVIAQLFVVHLLSPSSVADVPEPCFVATLTQGSYQQSSTNHYLIPAARRADWYARRVRCGGCARNQ